jgi:hypothetical protein
MKGAKRVLKAGMLGGGVNIIGQTELFNMAEPLKIGVRDNIEDQFRWDGDKSINGIVNDLLFVHPSGFYVNPLSGDRVSG